MGDEEKDEMDDLLEDDIGDDDMKNAVPAKPVPPTATEIKAAIKPILADAKKSIMESHPLSEDDGKMLDQLLAIYESDAVMNKLVGSGKSLKEITDSLKTELDGSIATFKAMPPLPPPPPPPPPPVIPLVTLRPKEGSFFDAGEKAAGVAAPVAAPAPLPAPEPPKVWHIHTLTAFDAIRKRLDGTNNLVQIIAGEGEDEVQMHAKDRIVVMLVKADGSKHKVLDKTMGPSFLYLFKYTLSSWGNSTLMPHMAMQKGLTPAGYQ